MILSGAGVRLRPWERADAERVRGWVNDPGIARTVDRATPVNDHGHARWFERMLEAPGAVLYAIELGGQHVGNVWLWEVDPRHGKAEVRILLGDPAARGKGAGTEALSLLAEHAWRGLRLSRLYAYVLAGNAPARRAFAKAGFQEEGLLRADRWVDGAWSDVVVFGRNVSERSSPSGAAPRSPAPR